MYLLQDVNICLFGTLRFMLNNLRPWIYGIYGLISHLRAKTKDSIKNNSAFINWAVSERKLILPNLWLNTY